VRKEGVLKNDFRLRKTALQQRAEKTEQICDNYQFLPQVTDI